jgi:hypothetical protein
MDRPTRQILLVVLVLGVAGVGYWVWERFFSHGAQIDAMHDTCIAEFRAGSDRVKAGIDSGAGAVPRGDPLAPAARNISAVLGKLIDEFSGNVSEAACGTLREACRLDYEGPACRKARAHFGEP